MAVPGGDRYRLAARETQLDEIPGVDPHWIEGHPTPDCRQIVKQRVLHLAHAPYGHAVRELVVAELRAAVGKILAPHPLEFGAHIVWCQIEARIRVRISRLHELRRDLEQRPSGMAAQFLE